MKKIPLTQGKFAIIDDEDYEYLNQWKWFFNNGYAGRSVRYKKTDGNIACAMILMHRVINKTPSGLETDHKNFNTIDNRKTNLRSCTRSQNMQNKSSRSDLKNSRYKGVHKKNNNRYEARITVSGADTSIGHYRTQEEAALAYNKKAIELHGEFAYLNKVENPENIIIRDSSGRYPDDIHGNAKLTPNIIREMRKMRKMGIAYRSIANSSNVGVGTAYSAINGNTWKHIK